MERQESSPLNGNCRFAIPKKGRLFDKVVEMLKGAGIEFRRESRLDIALCVGLPITLVFLPAADIAKYVGEGNVDIGITGIDVVQESDVTVKQIMDLGFGKCKLCVQAPVKSRIANVEQLAGKRIVTSFPDLTKKYFKKYDEQQGVTTSVKFVSGSVEAACSLGLADAVVDLVETGTTMKAAGLEIVADVLETQAVLIANPHHVEHQDLVDLIKARLTGWITAKQYSMLIYNIANDLLSNAVAITPGKRSPTITSLDNGDFKSVSALILKSEIPAKMDALHDIGATDILVLELANTRM
ncbi:hypothetical protein MPSEU_000656000 [Mayamaea pseudoterrestris]|nr:hypothetical protein MPSEU_000656000 [Mayamaea pseudoterrestris]